MIVRRRPLLIAAILGCSMLTRCAAPRIDGSTAERARTTIARVRNSVPDNRRRQFDSALDYLMSNGGAAMPLLTDPAVRKRIDARSSDEIITAADRLRSDRERAAHDEQTRRELSAISASFQQVAAADHPANASSLRFEEKKTATAPAASRPGGTVAAESPEALYSETPLSDDPLIVRLCSRYPEDNVFERRNCEQQEIIAKKKLPAAIPATLSTEVASRLRIACARREPDSYRGRLACIGNIARVLPFVMKNPAALDHVPPEYRADIAAVAGVKE